MANVIARLFGSSGHHALEKSEPAPDDVAFDKAMAESGRLLEKMHEESHSNDAARAVMATLWLHRHNVPFMTTLYESAAEMKWPFTQLDKGR